MTILYGTGFETGSVGMIPTADMGDSTGVTISAGTVHTGDYYLHLARQAPLDPNWVRFAITPNASERYASVWLHPSGLAKSFDVEFELTDGTLIGFRKESGTGNTKLHAYVDGSNVATGTFDLTTGTYFLFELYVKIANSGGKIQLTIDGAATLDLDYTGDTQPGATDQIAYLRYTVSTTVGDHVRIDDMTIRDDALPGDIRYLGQVLDSDSAVTWTPSTGGDNYALLDEVPASDSDYVETATNGNQDLYDVNDYQQNFALSHIAVWCRCRTLTAGGEIKLLAVSGATTSDQLSSGLGTSIEYLNMILETDPNTGAAWTKSGYNATIFGQEAVVTSQTVRVTNYIIETAYNQNASFVTRPLGLDVDVFSGKRIWVTTWENGTLFLQRIPSTLASQVSSNFGAATEAQVDARTFFISPFAPPFFGTAGLIDIVYVFGRWNDGSVKHLSKSIDGGSTFTHIGDATWGTGWVGGFFATDANNLFAFVNGGSRALWRSTNAGVSWVNLSTLPFDVDPGAVSLGGDGRLLISNRIAASQMAAYALSPDFSSWLDATGSPAFPQSGGGSNSAIWIT